MWAQVLQDVMSAGGRADAALYSTVIEALWQSDPPRLRPQARVPTSQGECSSVSISGAPKMGSIMGSGRRDCRASTKNATLDYNFPVTSSDVPGAEADHAEGPSREG